MLQLSPPILRHVRTLDIFVPAGIDTLYYAGQLYTRARYCARHGCQKQSAVGFFVINSHVRGYHIYKDIWSPSKGEVLQLQREPSNPEDKFAVTICLDGQIVGRVPAELARTFSLFLARECNSITATITGARINRGIGLGLEIPCFYKLNGPKVYVDRVKKL